MSKFEYLYKRYLTNSCTKEELKLLLQYFETEDLPENLEQLIEDELVELDKIDSIKPKYLQSLVDINHKTLHHRIQVESVRKLRVKRIFISISIAASLCLVSLFTYLIFDKQADPYTTQSELLESDVEPGGNRATLALSDGNKITLNESQEAIQIQGNSIKYEDGSEVITTSDIQMVSLSTPRAGQYQVYLPDGTKVWLNAESSIEYPTAFVGNQRLVTLKGEAYFDVAKDLNKPFFVRSKGQMVEVLGTEFNIKAYEEDQQTLTTLLEGRVKLFVDNKENENYLNPNEQAKLIDNQVQVLQVNGINEVAWKNGFFRFNAATLYDVLKQLQRWYDLEIDFTDLPQHVKVHGFISRDKKLSSVLYAIEEVSNVKFKISERRLEVVK